MFGSGDLGNVWFLFHSGNFKFFKNALGKFIPNCPPKHMIAVTKLLWQKIFKSKTHFINERGYFLNILRNLECMLF